MAVKTMMDSGRRLVGDEREDALVLVVRVSARRGIVKSRWSRTSWDLCPTGMRPLSCRLMTWRERLGVRAPDLAARPANDLGANLLRVLPHHQFIRPPVRNGSRHGSPEGVFWLRGRCRVGALRRATAPGSKLTGPGSNVRSLGTQIKSPRIDGNVPEGAAAAVGVDGVAHEWLLLEWAFQILPARHPDDSRVGDVVGRGRCHQLRRKP